MKYFIKRFCISIVWKKIFSKGKFLCFHFNEEIKMQKEEVIDDDGRRKKILLIAGRRVGVEKAGEIAPYRFRWLARFKVR